MTTSIEWTDVTWNPVTGCTKVSPGCKHCYAEGIADRFFAKQYEVNRDGSPREFTDVRCHEDRLDQPSHWKKPRRVFVNSMSDLFHEDVQMPFIFSVFHEMACNPQHTFQILTKRAERMKLLMEDAAQFIQDEGLITSRGPWAPQFWPLPNVWLGVSVENQKYADERIPLLLETPAAVRFLSVEPQLEAISMDGVARGCSGWWITCPRCQGDMSEPAPGGGKSCGRCFGKDGLHHQGQIAGIDWVICGGESGPGARPFNLAWAESLLGQCKTAGVPFFMKQIGSVPVINTETWREKYNPITHGWKEQDGTRFWQSARQLLPWNERQDIALAIYSRKGGDPAEWPAHLRVREFPAAPQTGPAPPNAPLRQDFQETTEPETQDLPKP